MTIAYIERKRHSCGKAIFTNAKKVFQHLKRHQELYQKNTHLVINDCQNWISASHAATNTKTIYR